MTAWRLVHCTVGGGLGTIACCTCYTAIHFRSRLSTRSQPIRSAGDELQQQELVQDVKQID